MAGETYYLWNQGRKTGPYSGKDLRRLASSGELLPTDLIQPSHGDKRYPASKVSGLFSADSSVPPPVPCEPPRTSQSWHYSSAGKRSGPVGTPELVQLVTAGRVEPDALVWRAGMDEWLPIGEVAELASHLPDASPPEVPSSSPPPLAGSSASPARRAMVGGQTTAAAGAEEDDFPSNFMRQVVDGGKIAGPLGGVFGFVGDVLNPLGPVNGVLFVLTLASSAGMGLAYSRHWQRDTLCMTRWMPERLLPFSVFAMLAFGVWFGLGLVAGDDGRGAVASHVDMLARLQNSVLGLRQDVAGVKQDTTLILRDTTEIKHQLGRVGEGGIIKTPATPADFYHNARFHELEGNFRDAFAAYERYLAFDQEFVDPYLTYLELLRTQRGQPAAEEEFKRLRAKYPENRCLEAASLMLLAGNEKQQRLEEFLGRNPEFGPAFLMAANSFSAAEMPAQSGVAAGKEHEYLTKFLELNARGKVQPYYLDKKAAIELAAAAKSRVNVKLNDDRGIDCRVSMITETKDSFTINDMHVRDVFFQFEGMDWGQIPAPAVRLVKTAIANLTVCEIPQKELRRYRAERLAADPNATTTLRIKYVDTDGRESKVFSDGPFPAEKILAWQLKHEGMMKEVNRDVRDAAAGVNESMKKAQDVLDKASKDTDAPPINIPKIQIPSFR